ncbi:MAG TPA: hypothetical protein VFG70_06755 [Gaiellaceae bacterium]|nr:hypothetical protein [Gaiellaceae bacterium]
MRAVASLAAAQLVAVASLTAFGLAEPAVAASCDQQVLGDWRADGRIDRTYELECYQVAVESLPPDLRDYTNAQEEIERALQSAARSGQPGPTGRTAPSSSSVLVPALAVAATGLLAGCAVWLALRTRVRRHRP